MVPRQNGNRTKYIQKYTHRHNGTWTKWYPDKMLPGQKIYRGEVSERQMVFDSLV